VTPNDPVTWAFYGLGLIATVVVTVFTTRIASKSWRTYFNERESIGELLPPLAKATREPKAKKPINR
jgi:hypothetical protein